jgi:hypothetical protein
MYDPRIVDEFFAMQAEDAGELPMASDAPFVPSTSPWATTAMAPAPANGPDLVSENQVLEMFYRLGGEIAATMRARDVGEIVWHHVSQCVPTCSFVMFLYEADGDVLVPLFRSDDRVISRDARIPLGERLSGWVAAHTQTMVNSDARLDQDPQLSEVHLLRSALATPVVQNGRVVGVLSFYSEEHDAFTRSIATSPKPPPRASPRCRWKPRPPTSPPRPRPDPDISARRVGHTRRHPPL